MKPIKAAELGKMVELGVIRNTRLLLTQDGWTVQLNEASYALALESGRARFFTSSDAALRFLRGRGILDVHVEMPPAE